MNKQRIRSNRVGIVAELAIYDLVHEWILSLCLVLAFAAVIAPLLLLMGLKHGTIATLRHKLIQDPVYREIRPAQTREYPAQWFDDIAARPEVSFLTPTILAASSIISVVDPATRVTKIYDLLPTGPGDPLLLENGGEIPERDQCVVTAAAGDELNLSRGDSLKVRATRSSRGRREFGEASLQVMSILNPRASGIPRVYAPLSFVLDVESYKEGLAAPSRGWPGGTLRPYFSYDGILLVLPQPLSPVKESGLIINTGLTSIEKIEAEKFSGRAGFPLKKNLRAYDLRPYQNAVHFSSLSAVKNKLRGQGSILLPYADDIPLKVSEGPETRALGLSISALEAKVLGLPELPWGKLESNPPNQKLLQILLPVGTNQSESIAVSTNGVDGRLTFPLVRKGLSFGNLPVVPAELIGVLRTARQRLVTYKNSQGEFLLSRTGFRGFRLYTRTIDDVVPLARELKENGIEVIAQTESIERVRILDRGLTNIFRLVAVVGIAGGIAALIASLYAAVERKQQELSVMRLIGLSRLNVFLFPIYQGITMALMSMIVAMGGYFLLSAVINRVFSSDLEMGERICELPLSYLVIGTATTVVVALMSSSFAAWRTTKIDPAEALRYE